MAIRCLQCGAYNADGADWCNQCYTSLTAPVVEPEPAPETAVAPEPDPTPAPAAKPDRDAMPAWTCPVCDGSNPVSSDHCSTCGTAMVAAFTPATEPVDGERAKLWSGLPGMGHAKAGAGPTGIAILLLVLMALGFGFVLLDAPATRAMAIVILVVGALVWLVSAVDVQRHVDLGSPWLFRPRVISGVAAVIIALLIVAVLLALGDSPS